MHYLGECSESKPLYISFKHSVLFDEISVAYAALLHLSAVSYIGLNTKTFCLMIKQI